MEHADLPKQIWHCFRFRRLSHSEIFLEHNMRIFGRSFGGLLYARIKRRLLLMSALRLLLRPWPISSNNTDWTCSTQHPHSQLGNTMFVLKIQNPANLKYCLWRNGPPVSLTNNTNLLITFVHRRYVVVFLRRFPSQIMHAHSRAYLLRHSLAA